MRKKKFIPPPKSQEFQLPQKDYEWLLKYIRRNYPDFTNYKFQITIERLGDGSIQAIAYRILPPGMNTYVKRFMMDTFSSELFRIQSEHSLNDIYHMIQKDMSHPLVDLLRGLL